jgi:hypothetical protein
MARQAPTRLCADRPRRSAVSIAADRTDCPPTAPACVRCVSLWVYRACRDPAVLDEKAGFHALCRVNRHEPALPLTIGERVDSKLARPPVFAQRDRMPVANVIEVSKAPVELRSTVQAEARLKPVPTWHARDMQAYLRNDALSWRSRAHSRRAAGWWRCRLWADGCFWGEYSAPRLNRG